MQFSSLRQRKSTKSLYPSLFNIIRNVDFDKELLIEIQKVIEEKQTLTPQEISELAEQTKPATVTTPVTEEERKRVTQSPVPNERETQILTKERINKEEER